MQLFLVHCGYYDKTLSGSIFENHTNFFVVAADVAEARAKAKELPEFRSRKMHVDGLQRIEAVDGFQVKLVADAKLDGQTVVENVNAWARTSTRSRSKASPD